MARADRPRWGGGPPRQHDLDERLHRARGAMVLGRRRERGRQVPRCAAWLGALELEELRGALVLDSEATAVEGPPGPAIELFAAGSSLGTIELCGTTSIRSDGWSTPGALADPQRLLAFLADRDLGEPADDHAAASGEAGRRRRAAFEAARPAALAAIGTGITLGDPMVMEALERLRSAHGAASAERLLAWIGSDPSPSLGAAPWLALPLSLLALFGDDPAFVAVARAADGDDERARLGAGCFLSHTIGDRARQRWVLSRVSAGFQLLEAARQRGHRELADALGTALDAAPPSIEGIRLRAVAKHGRLRFPCQDGVALYAVDGDHVTRHEGAESETITAAFERGPVWMDGAALWLPRSGALVAMGTDGAIAQGAKASLPRRLEAKARGAVARRRDEADRRALVAATGFDDEPWLAAEVDHDQVERYERLGSVGAPLPDAWLAKAPAALVEAGAGLRWMGSTPGRQRLAARASHVVTHAHGLDLLVVVGGELRLERRSMAGEVVAAGSFAPPWPVVHCVPRQGAALLALAHPLGEIWVELPLSP